MFLDRLFSQKYYLNVEFHVKYGIYDLINVTSLYHKFSNKM